ncbi:MAG: aminoacyl-tRNA hydrolase [Candidatus Abyssubacteria bacterium]
MRIVVGLGNPGKKYAATRHNLGFMVADELASSNGLSFSQEKFKSKLAHGTVAGEDVIIAKPQTFMNLSGEAVGPLVRFYKIPPTNLLVVYDDVDITFGKLRLRPSGGSGGHKGIQSIIEHLGTEEFPRLRIGIRQEHVPDELSDYVLSEFGPEEKTELKRLIRTACKAVEAALSHSFQEAMNQFN